MTCPNPAETVCVDAVRCISAALPQAAKSGHPGAPMGCAPMAHVLFGRLMRLSPKNPKWIARDRFVLSNGHACALQYTMLHLMGYDVSLDDLKSFRQLGSKTPGHPECGHTAGIELTSGPLGQGISQAVGLAIAAESMAATYNTADMQLFDSFIYTIVGDGCLQEGVAAEACSLAGHLGLGRLVVLYDRNGISIDGDTDLSFTEDVPARFRSYGWEVLHVKDGDHDIDGITAAIEKGKKNLAQPTFIVCNTTIGYGSLKQGTEKTHGSPLGVDDIKQLRQKFGFSTENMFDIPQDALAYYRQRGAAGDALYADWMARLTQYGQKYPAKHGELVTRMEDGLPAGWMDALPQYTPEMPGDSTRALSGAVLNCMAKVIPGIVGGSADLTGSNCSGLKNTPDFHKENRNGRYIRFGVREHGMAAICNGIAAFGGFRPFCATFLNFITYAWGAVRLSALSQLPVLYIATHDSIELGEDGPTHQPIELAPLCRATPNLIYFRPGDATEVAAGYATWLSQTTTPVVLALSRNAVPNLKGTSVEGAMRGGYILEDFTYNGRPKVILGSCGTELSLCVEAATKMRATYDVRVVSVPSWDLFRFQPRAYQLEVVPENVKSVYVEAANALGHQTWFTTAVEMTTFGASAPKKQLFEKFGYTIENIERVVRSIM